MGCCVITTKNCLKIKLSALLLSLSAGLSSANTTVDCVLVPSAGTEVASPVSGVMQNIEVDWGATVKKGDLLFSLASPLEKTEVELASARLEFARRKLDRTRALFKDNMISIQELDELETEVHVKAVELKKVKESLKRRQVRSPHDGVIFERFKDAGEYVSSEPVLELVSLDPLYAELTLPHTLYGQLQTGQSIDIALGTPVNQQVEGEVKVIDPLVDSASLTFRARVSIDNPYQKILAGVSCSIPSESFLYTGVIQ